MTPPPRNDRTGTIDNPLTVAEAPQPGPGESFGFLEPPAEPGDLGRLGKYRILRVLGQGGMGFVFAAEDIHLRRTVALKVMRPELAADRGFRERFLLEARASAQVASEFVVTVYDVGLAGDVPFIAMQLLNGEALQDRLERERSLPVPVAALVARQAAEGLAAAHALGLTHRDIKPANLWLEADRPGGPFRRVKILDFGLARPSDRDTRLTASGVIVGTPHYMAPEQASGQAVDGRADIFSLGCVTYTSLTGKLAFDGPSTMAVLMALANHSPPPLVVANLDVPPALSELIAKMMSKNRDLRPATAAAVVDALDGILAGLPDPLHPGRVSASIGRGAIDRVPPPLASPVSDQPRVAWGWAGSGTHPAPAAGSTPALSLAATPTQSGGPSPHAGPTNRSRHATAQRGWRTAAVVVVVLGSVAAAVIGVASRGRAPDAGAGRAAVGAGEPVPVGVLHSTTGTMALSEGPVADATLLAIDEVNRAGGVLGRPIKAVHADGQSDPAAFAREAERLVVDQKVAAVFGCWTSAARKAVKPVVEQHDGLLFYPVQSEGLEESPRIVYLGPVPNQQLEPALDHLVDKLNKRRFFFVGSDYVYPRATLEVATDLLKTRKPGGGRPAVVGSAFLPLGSKDAGPAVAAVKAAKPDVVVNAINGSSNVPFLELLNSDPELADVPVLSLSLTEADLGGLKPADVAGDFLAGAYFQSADSPEGRAFAEKVRARFGRDRTASDPMAAAYAGVHLWAKAVSEANSLEPAAVARAVGGLTYEGPAGYVRVDPTTHYTWLPGRVGRVGPGGRVEVVSGTGSLIEPRPYPAGRTRAEWDRFLNGLYVRWDNQWQAPAAKP